MLVLTFALFLGGILLIFFPSKVGNIIYATAGAIMICIYLVIDVQLAVGGKKHEWTIDDYIFAAICIYVDIINLFLYVLKLIGYANKN